MDERGGMIKERIVYCVELEISRMIAYEKLLTLLAMQKIGLVYRNMLAMVELMPNVNIVGNVFLIHRLQKDHGLMKKINE
jgi:hypothetical protein